MRYVIWAIVLLAIGASGFTGWFLAQRDARSAEAARDEAERFTQWARNLRTVPVTFIVTAPPETPADQTLYLSGSAPSLKAWAADGVPLTRRADGKYVARLEGENGLMTGLEHAFKVTRGNWATVETDEKGQERPNRTFTIDPGEEEATIEVVVASWRDGGKTVPGRVTRTGNIMLHRKFHSELLKFDRDLIVYLPPGYDDEANIDLRYPVLYMHDGQNLMDEDTSFKGIEWRVDETAERLIREGRITPLIIVGIYNTEDRSAEFTPGWMATAEAPGRAELYGKLLVEQIKPMIDAT
ncbi:MAG: alpha/beta hydrolase-fold protein, partial [Phycisphaerae bacterium]|nr:alpha/beta hydrolase-fold protein [Phycisphaerae bacterium]